MCVGVVAAMQVGKVAIATPLLQRELGFNLLEIGWILGAYATLGAVCALQFSLSVRARPPRDMVITGLGLIAIGSGLGMVAEGLPLLLVSRLIEGSGFLIIAVVIPALISRLSDESNRNLIISIWAAYMPAGIALMMLTAPFLDSIGWRAVWGLNALAALACMAMTRVFVPHRPGTGSQTVSRWKAVRQVFSNRACVLATMLYAFYTVQYFALVGFLPSMLTSELGISVALVGLISAGAVAANGVGNVLTGLLLRRGIPFWLPTCCAFVALAILPLGFLNGPATLLQVTVMSVLWLMIGGILPASILSSSPRLAPDASLTIVVVGLYLQGSNVGQLAGPALFGWWVETLGWERGFAYFMTLSTLGFVTALRLYRKTNNRSYTA
ncbi:MFS transporter [Mesorhizobium sp. A556]